jgi:hypothetical protein
MEDGIRDSVWRFELPRGRALTNEEFQRLSKQLQDLFQKTASIHEMLARFIISEERYHRFLVAFFENEKTIPETTFVFSCQFCQIFSVTAGSETIPVHDGITRLADTVRSTAEMVQKLSSDSRSRIDEFIARFHVRV